MDYLTKLPSELKLRVLNHLTDASDIVKIKTLNRTFYNFSYKFALELARQAVICLIYLNTLLKI